MAKLILRTRFPASVHPTPVAITYAALDAKASFKAVGTPANLLWQAYNSIITTVSPSPANLVWTPNTPAVVQTASPTPVAIPFTGITAVGASLVFDPSTLQLSQWVRDYSSSTWTSLASADARSSSGLTDFTRKTGGTSANDPAVGTLNGHGTADFDGSDDEITGKNTFGVYATLSPPSFSGWMLIRVTGGLGGNALGSDLWEDGAGTGASALYTVTSGSTVRYSVNAGAALVQRAITHDAWQLVTWRYDGTNVQIGVNEAPGAAGGASTAAFTTTLTSGGGVQFGKSIHEQQFLGRLAEAAVSRIALTDANFASVKSYINTRYALSL